MLFEQDYFYWLVDALVIIIQIHIKSQNTKIIYRVVFLGDYHILFFECGRDSKMFWIDIICYQSWKYYLKKYEWTTLKDIARLVVLWNTFSSKSDFYFSWDHSFYIFSDKCWYSKKLDILRRCKLKQDRIQIINKNSYLWIQQC